MSSTPTDTLYRRLGGYDAIAAVASALLERLMADSQLARFWQHRATDSVLRERQLLTDFLCANSGGPLMYRGRDMLTSHRGMGVSDSDWQRFLQHLRDTLSQFDVPAQETQDVLAFVESTKADIVEIE